MQQTARLPSPMPHHVKSLIVCFMAAMLRTAGRRVTNTGGAFSAASYRAIMFSPSTHSTWTGSAKGDTRTVLSQAAVLVMRAGLVVAAYQAYQVYRYTGLLQEAEEAHISTSLVPKPAVLGKPHNELSEQETTRNSAITDH